MMKNPPEREESVGFPETEEIDWRQYLADFRTTVWPMFEAEGFTFVQAFQLWRQEMMMAQLIEIKNRLGYED